MDKTYYLTSAIPYVNAAPHIGHAQEFVYADCIRRYQKLHGNDVRYLCGADENALKIVQAAEKAGQDPQAFTDVHQQEFLDVAKKLNVQFDVWQRGTNKDTHYPSAQKLWELCAKNGDIYKKTYTGLYCVGCEAFYPKEELNDEGECFEHPGRKLDEVSEENYFFKLSKYQDFLLNLIETDTLKITPEIRKNEMLAFINRGLDDFSISRSIQRAKGWGVPVPGDSGQIMYVWFDALNIYQSGIGFGWNEDEYAKWWPAQVHVIGKGITRFHAIYWPAILSSAGLELPKELFVHGYLTVDGQKMSKTIGNVVDPTVIIDKYGTDAVRYYLLREIPSYGDGDFSERRFVELYNADLANGLGNLISRVAKLCQGLTFQLSKNKLTSKYTSLIEQYRFDDVLESIWNNVRELDQYINQTEPWKVQDKKQLAVILEKAVNGLRQIGSELQPFLPETAEKMLAQFGGETVSVEKSYFVRIQH